MKKNLLLFLCFLSFFTAYSQNWDINTLERINSWDSKFVRNYSKGISKSTPYVAIAVPLAIAAYAGVQNDQSLLKDAVYIGTSIGGAFALTYGLKYTVDRKRPYDRYPDKISVRDRESSPSFPSVHTAVAFSLAISLISHTRRSSISPPLFVYLDLFHL